MPLPPDYSKLVTDADSLTANHRGELTETQRDWLKVANPGFDLKAFGFVIAVLVFMGISFAPTAGQIPAEGWLSIGVAALIIGLVAGVPFVRNMLFHRQLIQEMESGRVESAAGLVKWKRNQYGAEVDGRPLKTQIGFSIEPGGYNLYYLPQTRWLVGAERANLQSPEASTLQQVLARVHRSDPDALEANRKGELAEGQRRYLLFVVLANFFAVLVALGLVGILIANILQSAANDTAGGGYILMAMPLVLAGYFIYRGTRLGLDVASNTVVIEKGKGSRSATGGRSPSFYYHIGDSPRLSVSATAFLAFVEGKHYTVYYTPKAKRIMNIEVGK